MSTESSSPPENVTTPLNRQLDQYQAKILGVVITGLPLILIQMLWKFVAEQLTAQPWYVICLLVPLTFIAILSWKAARGGPDLLLKGRYRAGFLAYVLFFSLASYSDVLVWHRDLTVFGQKTERSWLVPARWGDWRYHIAPRKPMSFFNILVVTVDMGTLTEAGAIHVLRNDFKKFIKLAAAQGARGITFDFYFEKESDVDSEFRGAIENCGIEIVTGYTFKKDHGRIMMFPPAPALERFLPLDRQGHLVGLIEPDRRVRLIPLYFRGMTDRPSLSLKTAQYLSDDRQTIVLPSNGLLRYAAPRDRITPFTFEELTRDPNMYGHLNDSWIMVGDRSEKDTFHTPYGKLPGVLIHAYAVHSLLNGHFFERTPWWASLLLILISCYTLVTMRSRGMSRMKIVGAASLFSILMVTVSIALLRFWLIWLDIVYALTGIWLLTLILHFSGKLSPTRV